jgi:hypothetical protein
MDWKRAAVTGVVAAVVGWGGPASAAQKPASPPARKPGSKSAPAGKPSAPKPAAKPPVRPAAVKPAPPAPIPPAGARLLTPVTLASILKELGYAATAAGPYLRLQIKEEGYSYPLDLSFSNSGAWLVVMAHLATVEDLTRVPATPLLALLSTNDSLLGMAFSYNRESGNIMLNAAVPNRSLDAAAIKNIVEGLKKTVRETEGLWDTHSWK